MATAVPHSAPGDWTKLDLPPWVHGGWTVFHVTETGSTNTDLLDLSTTELADRTVLVTDHQTAGRGRLDRVWSAPPGANLLMSILFRDVPPMATDLTRACGVAIADAVRSLTGAQARLKWPNDVLIDGRKAAGVLAQRSDGGAVVVGMGVNVGWAPEGAARVESTTPHALLAVVLAQLDLLLTTADAGDDAYLDMRYRHLLATLGQRVRVELPSGDLVGRAIAIERDGGLIVLDECAVSHRVDVGDVVHLRSEPG